MSSVSVVDGGVAADQAVPTGPVRSRLYPKDWQPGQPDGEGRFLADFSYAGYKNGEQAIPDAPPGALYDVRSYGADPTAADDNGCTPLDWLARAPKSVDRSAVRRLLEGPRGR